jgi:uncharacterized repeat protein (TIGR03803 family)
MKRNIPLAVLFALLASSAFGASPKPVAVYTFTCNGSAFWRIGPCPNGGIPYSLLHGSDGNFYGNAQVSSEGRSDTGGTVFSLTSSGAFKLLHTFRPGPNHTFPNGSNPGLLVEGSDGKLYGSTIYGGINGGQGFVGDGVLFRVNKNGSGFQVVHKFCSETNCTDGAGVTALVAGTDGNLYGTTFAGGTGSCSFGGCGTIFKVTPSSGAYEVVFSFPNQTTDGYEPTSLILGPDGSLYGNSGLLFRYTPATGVFQIILKFPLINGRPSLGTAEVVGPNGNLYGLYFVAGTSGIGLFEVAVDGSNLQLFPFYNTIDGGGSPGQLILASDGNFWLADYNGSTGYGDILSLSPSDGTVLQTFTPFSTSAAVGAYPAGIIQAKDGTLWGTTTDFGDAPNGYFAAGTVFKLNAGLPPR